MFDLHIQKQLSNARRQFALSVRVHTSAARVVLLGHSGAGKSLTLKAIAGLLRPDGGHIRVGGATFFDAAQRIDLAPGARRLGYVFQDYALFPHLNVRQNVMFGLHHGLRNPPRDVHAATLTQWLERFSLHNVARQFPHELSGGQKQRVALARALICAPRALLLDEPFAALDATLRQQLREELLEVQKQLDIPLMLITHDPEDAQVLGEAVVRIEEGQSVDAGAG